MTTANTLIRAERFELVDANGKVRAVLGMTEAGPRLVMSDENGKARAWLDVDKNGPGLGLSDENGKTRVWLVSRQPSITG